MIETHTVMMPTVEGPAKAFNVIPLKTQAMKDQAKYRVLGAIANDVLLRAYAWSSVVQCRPHKNLAIVS